MAAENLVLEVCTCQSDENNVEEGLPRRNRSWIRRCSCCSEVVLDDDAGLVSDVMRLGRTPLQGR